jgi:hypothetical protein
LSGGQPTELEGVERHVARNHRYEQRTHGIDHAPNPDRQHVDEKCHAEVLAAGKGAGGTEEARSDHEAAGHIIGPLDRCIEQEAQQHRTADDQKIGNEEDRRRCVAQYQQRSHDPVTAALQRRGA